MPIPSSAWEGKSLLACQARGLAAHAGRLQERIEEQLQCGKEPLVRLHRVVGPSKSAARFAQELAQTVAMVLLAEQDGGGRDRKNALPRDLAIRPLFQGLRLAAGEPSRGSRNLAKAWEGLQDYSAQVRLERETRTGLSPLDQFYELFLDLTAPGDRQAFGLYFTPAPVVSYIVEGIDQLLRSELSLRDGLADCSTWGDFFLRTATAIPQGARKGDPVLGILDPAVGTGAFLIAVIDRVYRTFKANWEAEGRAAEALSESWGAYVRKSLLPRLHGFELLLASWAVARLALARKLRETGYLLGPGEALSLWNVDALEPCGGKGTRQQQAAEQLRRHQPLTVLLGNPPFSGTAPPGGPWIERLLEDYKTTVRKEERQIQRLSNLYVRFLRFLDWKADQAGLGVLGVVTDRGYLEGVLFRDLRKRLLSRCQPLYVVDLGGALSRGAVSKQDANLFDIRQPVAITLGVFRSSEASKTGRVQVARVSGSRAQKLVSLGERSLQTTAFSDLLPAAPLFRFQNDTSAEASYRRWPSVPDLFGSGEAKRDREGWQGTGFKTRQDGFVVGFTAEEAVQKVQRLANRTESAAELREELQLCRTVHFNLEAARAKAASSESALRALVRRVAWRPLDYRYLVWCREFVCEPKLRTLRHLLAQGNVGLAVLRQDRSGAGAGVFVVRGLVAKDLVSNLDDALLCPLYLQQGAALVPNLNPTYLAQVEACTGLRFGDASASRKQQGDRQQFGAWDLFGYVYAVLSSPSYRSRYKRALCADYPRVPFPRTAPLFWNLVGFGQRLCALHLSEPPEGGEATNRRNWGKVQRVQYDAHHEKVALNATQTLSVPQRVWDYRIGNYLVCKTWLAGRRGRALTALELERFRCVTTVLQQCLRVAQEIDSAIESQGGWEAAFG